VCHTCIRDFKKAINEFSICLSLDPAFADAYLEKAKCYFLLGNTEKGFGSLKQFMELSPDDLSIYKWIGDLLYEGMSYGDALKAYGELGAVDDLDTHIMKLKCTFRVGSLSDVTAQLRVIEKHPLASKEKIAVDGNALTLLGQLVKQDHKNLQPLVKKINKSLEGNVVGYLFQLVDCMNLMGVASFYAHRYTDAYESFLLVLELYQSLEQKQAFSLKSETCDEHRNLSLDDIYANIIACEFAQGNHE
jgi:tetratricopeptide (TPR) repeat protein